MTMLNSSKIALHILMQFKIKTEQEIFSAFQFWVGELKAKCSHTATLKQASTCT